MSALADLQQNRVFGEDAPLWLAWGLALVGTLGTGATALLLMQGLAGADAGFAELDRAWSWFLRPDAAVEENRNHRAEPLAPGGEGSHAAAVQAPGSPANGAPLGDRERTGPVAEETADAPAVAPAAVSGSTSDAHSPVAGSPPGERLTAEDDPLRPVPATGGDLGEEHYSRYRPDEGHQGTGPPMDPVDSPVVDSPEILAEAQAAAGGYAGEGNAETPTVGVQEEETVTGPARAGPEAMDESGPDEEVAQIDVPPRLAEAAAEMDEAINPEEAEAAILTTATPDLVPGELRAGVARDSDPSAAPAEGTRETPCVPLFVAAFDRDSERPRFADREAKVKRLSAWLVAHPRAEVIVEGHTDAVGSPDYNLLLSERRAQAVAEMLMGAGVPADQLVVRGFGETVPLEGSSEARQHRRVSFRVTGYQACPSTPPE